MKLNEMLKQPEQNLYIRLSTSHWHDKRGVHIKRSLTTLRRKSKGAYDLLLEDSKAMGAEPVFDRIVNLDDCKDGIYTVKSVNESHDWETGYIEDYDYKLIEVDDGEL